MKFPLKGLFFLAIGFFVFGHVSVQAQTLLLEDNFYQTDISLPSNLPLVYSQNNLKTVDKTEVKIQDLTNGVWLNYRIRFQNNTNGIVANIRIRDSLSAHLDFSTFQFTGSSHSGQFLLYTSGNLYIYYTAINLPDSSISYGASQGSFRFKIKLKENLPLGTTIYNDADIIFDSNSAIITNTVQTDIVSYISVANQNSNNSFLLYPNPVRNVLRVDLLSDNINDLQIVDMTGKLLLAKNVNPGELNQKVDVSGLATGMYFVHLIGAEGVKSLKLLKY